MWLAIIIAGIIIADAIVTVGGYKGWFFYWHKVENVDEEPDVPTPNGPIMPANSTENEHTINK